MYPGTVLRLIRWFGLLCGVLVDNVEVVYRLHQSLLSEAREEMVEAIRTLAIFAKVNNRLPTVGLLDPIFHLMATGLAPSSKRSLDLLQLLLTVDLEPAAALLVYRFLTDLKDQTNRPAEFLGLASSLHQSLEVRFVFKP